MVIGPCQEGLADTFGELLDRWANRNRETDRNCCRNDEAEAEDPFFHRAADAGFFGGLSVGASLRERTAGRPLSNSRRSGRGAWIRGAGAMPPTPFWAHAMRADSGRPSSSMRFRTWTADVHLSRPTLIRTRAQPVPDHALEPADGGLGPGARVGARGLLPAHPALLGDELQVAVPLRRRGLGRGAGHGGRARRHDDVRARVALGHVGVNALLVVRAVRRAGQGQPRGKGRSQALIAARSSY